eukprot:tig00000241_g20907.t1
MHAAELKVHSAHLITKDGECIKPVVVRDIVAKDILSLEFTEQVKAGRYTVAIAYDGSLNDRMHGFYRSKYTTASGETRYAGCTQFEATDARRAFPCWDEPLLKATFDVTIRAPANRVVLSNMPEASSQTNADGSRTVAFQRTPVMSTYLLAWVIGEFDFVAGTTKEGVYIRVYTPVGKKEQGTFALEVALKSLSYFTEYFGIPYPLAKLDCVAIPDFAAGAMENWGLVTYREIALLIDAANSSAALKMRVAEVVAHELAHQWFGNLVTMEWWTHLWLNEGFATWAANLAVDHIYPDWNMWLTFLTGNGSRALSLDALKSSHPIEVEVKSSGEINEIFDAISYSKGACVIRMLASFMGYDKFRDGLRSYLKAFAYKNAVTEDLWAALATASGLPIRDIMDSWTKQTGYPILTVEETSSGLLDAITGKRTFAVEQKRFISTGELSEEDAKRLWWVPIGVTTEEAAKKGEEVRYQVVHDRTGAITASVSKEGWVKLNAGQSGLYRVKYSDGLLKALVAPIRSLALPAGDRLGLVMDGYTEENEYAVWSELSGTLDELSLLLGEEPFYDKFEAFGRALFRPAYQRLGWEQRPSDSHLTVLLRSIVLSNMGHFGDEEVIAEARKRFAAFLTDRSSLPPDFRSIVYSVLVMHGTEADYEGVLRVMRESELHEEKIRCLRALGAAERPELIKRTLDLSLSDEVRSQDTGRWATLHERYGKGGFLLSSIVSACTKNHISLAKAEEIRKFFAEHPVDNAKRTIEQSLERIATNSAWLESQREGIKAWLEANAK